MRCSPRSSLSRPLFFNRGSAPFSMAPSPVGGPSETAGLGDVVGASWMTSESAMALTTPGAGWFGQASVRHKEDEIRASVPEALR